MVLKIFMFILGFIIGEIVAVGLSVLIISKRNKDLFQD